MPDDLYSRDALLWSEQQADLLRRLSTGERLNAPVDWPNVIEEILDVGLSELHACEHLLEQAIAHLLKLQAVPDGPSSNHWRVEVLAFFSGARRHYSPSMQRRIDLQAIYGDAARQAAAALADGQTERPWPAQCPFTIAALIDPGAEPQALAAQLDGGSPA